MTTSDAVDTEGRAAPDTDDPARTHVDAVLPDDIRAFLLDYQRRPAQIRHLVRMYEIAVGLGAIDP